MTALSWDVFSALQVLKNAGIKCICWLLSNNKSLLLCIPLELFMYRVPWYIVMWLGSVERRCPLNHTFKIKVIWEQNHISGDSFSFLCQWLTTFPFLNAREHGVPLPFIVTFCLTLLPSVQSRSPPNRQAAPQGPRYKGHLWCEPLWQERQSWGGEGWGETAHWHLKEQRASCKMELSNFSCSSARFSVSVPLRLELLVFEANTISVLQYLAMKVEAVN